MVPTHWYPNDQQVVRLWEALAELGMYVAFHCGIFFDGRESSYCRPTFFEAVHQAPNFKGHLAHVGWPWVDECIASTRPRPVGNMRPCNRPLPGLGPCRSVSRSGSRGAGARRAGHPLSANTSSKCPTE